MGPGIAGLDRASAACDLPIHDIPAGRRPFFIVYLLMLGRNAWKQGEMRQFLSGLAMAVAMVALIAAIVLVYDRLFGA